MEISSSPDVSIAGRKRAASQLHPHSSVELQPSLSLSTSGSAASTSLGSPVVNNAHQHSHKRYRAGQQQQHQCQQADDVQQFPVLEYHLAQQQCQQHMQGTFLNNALQPADSSTWSNWQQLPAAQQFELLSQAGAAATQPQPQQQLVRSNSAPELVKLTQADSAAWQQAGHAAGSGAGGGGAMQPTSTAAGWWVV